MLRKLFLQYSLTELAHHPWRSLLAVLAIALGVALGFGVHLINQSALSEFSQAVRSINGEPDIELRAANGTLDEKLYPLLAQDARVKTVSPVIEIDSFARKGEAKLVIKIMGIDPLVAATLSPALIARPDETSDRFSLFADDAVFLSRKAMQQLKAKTGDTITLQSGTALKPMRIAGTISLSEASVAVMDIAAAQSQFAMLGQLSRIDIALTPGAQWRDIETSLQLQGISPQSLRALKPGDGQARISNLSRAYRVNLTVLALVALFTGGFLVFSIQAMTVAQRTPQLALLGILGTHPIELRLIICAESLLLGIVGAAGGILLGTGLAALALHLLGGDLGGGYFSGVTPSLQFSFIAALAYGVLGIICALLGGWLPAAQASQLPLVSALKSSALSGSGARVHSSWLLHPAFIACVLITLSIAMCFAPPIFGLPYLAYIAIAVLLVGGVIAVPALLPLIMRLVPKRWQQHAVGLLALQRATHYRQQAAVAICGVVASLSLAVALTVMVASFRDSMTSWLDSVLPAQLYARSAPLQSAQSAGFFTAADLAAMRNVKGIARVEGLRLTSVMLERMPRDAQPLALISRNFMDANDPGRTLPLVGELVPAQADAISVYASEAAAELYGLKPGTRFTLPLSTPTQALVRGVWRDYARQTGALTVSLSDFQRITQDTRVNDVALWLDIDAAQTQVEQRIRTAIPGGEQLEFASSREIRKVSLTIFDRSFAVTVWLQILAMGIGLFGIAASFSAQVLARRKEFGMLIHLGYTRAQLLWMVAAEGAAWTLVGALLGIALGLAVSVVLVHVVNPQSFHWTMEMHVPWGRLLWLGLAVIAAGCTTALWAARQAAGREAVLAVRADW
jgi:putative ABC transport system permease protein